MTVTRSAKYPQNRAISPVARIGFPRSIVGRRISFADMQAIGARYRTAVPESGHAMTARLLQLPNCGEASIAPHAYAKVPIDCGWRSICALMGGACAEIAAFGD